MYYLGATDSEVKKKVGGDEGKKCYIRRDSTGRGGGSNVGATPAGGFQTQSVPSQKEPGRNNFPTREIRRGENERGGRLGSGLLMGAVHL